MQIAVLPSRSAKRCVRPRMLLPHGYAHVVRAPQFGEKSYQTRFSP